MVKEISFIHAADLHLDSPFKGLADAPQTIFSDIRKSTFQAFDKLILTAIEKQVDFVLLVGDLFDNEKQSLKAQVHLRNSFQKLSDHNISVYLSYGNHDFLKGNIHPITYPNNVYIFPNENVSSFIHCRDGKEVAAIYGFSYENRAITQNKSKEFNIIDERIPWHIGMLHGSVHGNKDHDPYAPFSINDLKKTQLDYWALGHIHTREILSENPPIIYPGNIQGRHRNEREEKGCYYIKLTQTKRTMDFIPLQSIIFDSIEIDVSQCKTIHELEPIIQQAIEKSEVAQLVDIEFTGGHDFYKWEADGLLKEIIELVNETISHKRPWIFIYRYKVNITSHTEDGTNDYFIDEFIQTIDHLSVHSVVEDVYSQRQSKRYLTELTEEKQQEIKKKATQLIMNELLYEQE